MKQINSTWDWLGYLLAIILLLILIPVIAVSFPIVFIIYAFFKVLIEDIISFWKQFKSNPHRLWERSMSFIQDNALIIALTFIYIFFYRSWESWIGDQILDQFLCHFESNLLNDIIFFILSLACFITVLINWKKRPKRQSTCISIIAIVFWIYYRLNHGLCGMDNSKYYMHFTSLSIHNSIKYFDIVLVYAMCKQMSLIISKYYYYSSSIMKFDERGFTRGLPISNKTDDELERDKFAKSAVEKLLQTDTSTVSFTFGIDAPWGSGKTSFINLMKNHLESNYESGIIIDFNPWLYGAEKDLITAFFDELSKTLKQYDPSLAKNLIDYSKLLSVFDTTETKIISSLLDLVQQDDHSLQEKKQQISEAIIRIRRSIFVFIDDLDRLNADEIMEMMKLIRNISTFPYMYIVAAYDKSYLIKCLSTKMKSGVDNFIEKIFEHEDILNPCSNESLRRVLADKISIRSNKIEEYIMDHNNATLNVLSNLREVYRLSNRFNYSYNFSKGHINTIDLLLFELFKTKYPVVFSLFSQKWHEILLIIENNTHHHYTLFQGKDKDGHFDFIEYINNHQVEMGLNDFDVKTIRMILFELFMWESDSDNSQNRFNYRINDVMWFNRYLNLTQLKSDITTREFNEVMGKTFEEIKEAFDAWSMNKSNSLKHRLLNYDRNEKLNHRQLKQLIQAIFYAMIQYDWDIYSELNEIISHLKRFHNNKYNEDDRLFIMRQLKEYGDNKLIINYICYLYKEKKYIETPLDYDSLIIAQQRIFYHCCKKSNGSNIRLVLDVFCYLLGLNDYNLYERVNNERYVVILVNSMQRYAKKHIVKYLESLIDIKQLEINDKYDILPLTKIIWESWDNFKRVIFEITDSNQAIIEFQKFYIKYERNGYKPVHFVFHHLNI